MQHRTPRLRRIAAAAALTTLALATIGTGVAAADATGSTGRGDHRGRAHLTAEQRSCLEDQGIRKPAGRPTKAEIKALKAAAEACDIPLGRLVRHHIGHAMADLTDEQRQCLEEAGVTKPEGRPTEAQLKAFAAAAKSCGVPLRDDRRGPGHGHGPRLTDEQRQCLAEAGVTKPEGEPTEAQRDAMRAAAESCGITLPDRDGPGPRGPWGRRDHDRDGERGERGHGPRLTDEQRQCLEDAGVTRPEGRPTEAQRDAMRAAAESCGITPGRR